MKKINLGNSRYGDARELHQIQEGLWSTEGFKKIHYMRVGERTDGEEGFQFYDLDGGPMLQIGSPIASNETITHIKFEDGRYLIYTDKYVENSNNEQSEVRDKNEEKSD